MVFWRFQAKCDNPVPNFPGQDEIDFSLLQSEKAFSLSRSLLPSGTA